MMKLWTLVLLLLLSTAHLRAADEPVILLTGFEPFGGAKLNASWETVKTFQGKTISGHRVETALLPVVYDDMEKPLLDALEKHKPAAVISFGVGSHVIQIETLARNGYHPKHPKDNKGAQPPRAQIAPDGPAEIPTGLPATKIVAALKSVKIGAAESDDAGGYLCNECFYRLMNTKNAPKIRGFVHVPDFGKPDPEGGKFDAEKLKRAVELTIKTVLESK